MTVLANISTFAGTDTQEISAGDARWVQATGYGSIPLIVDAFNRAQTYPGTGVSKGYWWSTNPSNGNQIVRATIQYLGTVTSEQYYGIFCREQAGGAYCMAYYKSDGAIYVEASGMTAATISITPLSGGGTGVMELSVTGVSPSISLIVKWNGSVVGSYTINNPDLDFSPGKIGIFAQAYTSVGEANGPRYGTYYAEDGVGGGGGGGSATGADASIYHSMIGRNRV